MKVIRIDKRRRLTTLVGSFLLGFGISPLPVLAQAWPSKPIRIITSAPPGGSVDIAARMVADGLQKELGQPVLIDSKPGGAGTISANEVVTAPADGYTFHITLNGIVTEVPHVLKMRFDPVKDLKPIAEICGAGLFFLAHPSVPGKTLAEAISFIKTNPNQVSYASYSAGTISHTMGLELNRLAGINMTHVPYRGSQPGLQDLMGGHVQFMFDGPGNTLAMIKAGKIKALAISGPKRSSQLPDVPTFAELGYPSIDGTATVMLFSRAEVPADVQAKIRSATLKVMAQPSFKARMGELGMDEGSGATPEALAITMRAAHEKQGGALRALGVSPKELGS